VRWHVFGGAAATPRCNGSALVVLRCGSGWMPGLYAGYDLLSSAVLPRRVSHAVLSLWPRSLVTDSERAGVTAVIRQRRFFADGGAGFTTDQRTVESRSVAFLPACVANYPGGGNISAAHCGSSGGSAGAGNPTGRWNTARMLFVAPWLQPWRGGLFRGRAGVVLAGVAGSLPVFSRQASVLQPPTPPLTRDIRIWRYTDERLAVP